MKTIQNKTHRSLRVPLPQGRTLHLGPGQVGQISAHAAEHPPLVRLVKAGELEIHGDGGQAQGPISGPGAVHASTHGHPPNTSVRRRGDR